jgi:hypothetical protein
MQHENAARTWTCSVDMACSIHMDIQQARGMDMQHVKAEFI